jgi:hypothetical protein
MESAASLPIRSNSHEFVGDIDGSIMPVLAGSWTKGAWQEKGNERPTSVGSTQ